MTRDEFLDKQFDISVMAGMNQRYQKRKASVNAWWDRFFRILIGFLTLTSAILSIVTISFIDAGWIAASVAVAVSAAVIGIVLNVLPFADRERYFLDLYRRWCDLREEIDSLNFELVNEPTKSLTEKLRHLDGKSHRISALDTDTDKALLQQCFDEEHRSRHEVASIPAIDGATRIEVVGAVR